MQIENANSSRLVRLEKIFRENLNVIYLEIENESAKHSGHYSGDGESHWRVLVVAEEFTGLARVQRHQKINSLVQNEFLMGMHALALQLFDILEWEKKKIDYFEKP